MAGRATSKIVDLTRQWALETDNAKRKAITDQLQHAHMDNVSYIPLGQYRSIIAYRKELTGLIRAPSLFYWNIEKKSAEPAGGKGRCMAISHGGSWPPFRCWRSWPSSSSPSSISRPATRPR